MNNNFIVLTTHKFASSRELENTSWWALVDKNKFIIANNRVSNDVIKDSIVITNQTPNILEVKRTDVSICIYTKLSVFNVFNYYNINHPKAIQLGAFTGATIVNRLDSLNIENDLEICIDDVVSLRSNMSSRGIGNINVKVNKLIELTFLTHEFNRKLGSKKGSEALDLYKQFRIELDKLCEPRSGYGDYRTDDEKYRIEEILLDRPNQLLLQEYIDMPYLEYRLYLTYDMESIEPNTLIGIRRKGYGLTSNREEMVDVQINGEDMVNLFADDGFKSITDKLLKMMKEQKHLVISVDLYKIQPGDWGVFEFSTEYSIEGVSVEHVLKLKKHINSSLEKIYIDKINSYKRDK